MNQDSSTLDRLALLAQERPGLLAGPLMLYRDQEDLNDQQLAAQLGCDAEAIPRLALCQRPRPAPHFMEDVERIARYIHADMMRLARLIRAAESREALRARQSAFTPPALLAARDHDEENSDELNAANEGERPNG